MAGANLDMPISLPRGHGPVTSSLRELMAVPVSCHGPMLLEAHMRLVNANHFQLSAGDACHDAVMSNIGEPLLLWSWTQCVPYCPWRTQRAYLPDYDFPYQTPLKGPLLR